MIGILKKATKIKSGFICQLLVFLAVFIALLGESAGVIYLAAFKRILPIFAVPFFQVLGYLTGGFLLYYGIGKIVPPKNPDKISVEKKPSSDPIGQPDDHTEAVDNTEAEDKIESISDELAIISKKKTNSCMIFILNFLLLAGITKLLSYNITELIKPDADPIFFKSLALTLLGLVFLEILILNSWLITNNSAGPNQYFSFFTKSVTIYLKGIKYNIISSIIIVSISAIILLLHLFIWPAIFSAGISTFLIIFYKTVTHACLIGWTLIFLTKTATVIYQDNASYEPRKTLPLGYIMAVLSLAALVYTSLPASASIESEYERIIAGAEGYRTEGQLYLCGNEYKKAYALLKAYKGYLLDMQIQKDDDATDEEVNKAMKEANALFKEAYEFYPNGGKIYYLDALRKIEGHPSSALALALDAKKYDPESPQVHLLILNLSHVLENDELETSISKEIIAKGIYENAGSLNSISSRKINAVLESIDSFMTLCLENITTMAYDYYNNQLYPEAMEELVMIKEILPQDIVTNYLIAMTDLELKSDNKKYTVAIEAAQTILDLHPDQKWAQNLYSGVILRAGNQNVMDEVIKEAYESNPENPEVAEQYAYSLLKKNYHSSYYDVTQEAEAAVDKILARDRDRWFAVFCKSLIELYKGEYESSLNHISHFSDLIVEDSSLFTIYDELYNTYVMKYAKRMTMDGVAGEVLLSGDTVDDFTYNYIMGAFGTMSKEVDTLATIEHLARALDYNPSFSKPYYMIGNAYMEYGHLNNDPQSFVLAEEYYKKSIQIFEKDPYAWFALGHAYKKQERYKEAMGAFQKTLTLMPAQDHQSDHFGISIHSARQIEELEHIIASREGQ